MSTNTTLSPARAISLIARREITTRARTKSFLITIAIMLVVVVGGLIVLSLFVNNDDGDKAEKVGVVGNAALSQQLVEVGKATGSPVEIVRIDTAADARKQAADGDVKAALVPGSQSGSSAAFVAITKDGLDSGLAGVIRAALGQEALRDALTAQNVDANAVTAAAAERSTLDVVQTEKKKTDEDGQRLVIALAGVVLLGMAIMIGGQLVAAGVVEEKTSRVVELLLSTVKPLHLLWGKIIGVGIVALAQVVVLGAAALVTASATGLLTVPTTAVSMFLAVIAWFLLGYVFFAALFASAGALVSRQEEIGSTTSPLLFLSIGSMYVAIFGYGAIDSTALQVLTWIPPFSASLMPLRIATGDTNAVQVVLTFAIMIAACLAAAWVAARVYQRSILQTGSKVPWREALRGSRNAEKKTAAPVG